MRKSQRLEIWNRIVDRLRHVATQRCCYSEREDVVQDFWFKFYKVLQAYQPNKDVCLDAWIIICFKKYTIDHNRKYFRQVFRNRRACVNLEEIETTSRCRGKMANRLSELVNSLAQLPTRERRVVELFLAYGFRANSGAQVCAELDMPKSTAYLTLARAKQKLQGLLK